MKVIICYDVSDNRIRRKLVKFLEKFGIRVQYSVFTADLSEREIKTINQYVDRLFLDQDGCKFYICRHAGSVSTQHMEGLPGSFLIV